MKNQEIANKGKLMTFVIFNVFKRIMITLSLDESVQKENILTHQVSFLGNINVLQVYKSGSFTALHHKGQL